MDSVRFERLLQRLGDRFEVLSDMLRELRGKLFGDSRVATETPSGDHGLLYDGIIGAISVVPSVASLIDHRNWSCDNSSVAWNWD
jgi:hypothetical protein